MVGGGTVPITGTNGRDLRFEERAAACASGFDTFRVPGAALCSQGRDCLSRNVTSISPDCYIRPPGKPVPPSRPGTRTSQQKPDPRSLSNSSQAAQTRMKEAH